MRRCHERGVTLVELVVAITIIAVAIASVLAALSGTAVNSANRMVRQQGAAIAEAYLEEIMQKPFTDPDGGIEAARAAFDDISDYNGLNNVGAQDQTGAAIAGLGAYQVSVAVGAGTMTGIPAAAVRLITVTVTHTSGVTVVANGYKTNHP